MSPFYRYYVRTLPNGKPVQCPGNRGVLMDLYFTTIRKLTGIEPDEAKRILAEGRPIRTEECEFWARNVLDTVIILEPRTEFRQ